MYKGIGASAGIGIGKVVIIKEQELNYSKVTITDKEAEKKRLADAIDIFVEKTTVLAESMRGYCRRSGSRDSSRSYYDDPGSGNL